MGLLDQVMGAVTGAAGQQTDAGNPLISGIMQLLNNPKVGGISGLVQHFQNGGLAEIVNSWVSTGQNLPVSADQVQGALGSEQIQNIASQLGLSTEQASSQLAEYLPQIIDNLTPNGTVPEGGDLMAQGLDLLKGKFFA